MRDKAACLRSRAKLKGTNVYVIEDVSYATQRIRKSLLPELKRKWDEGYIAYFPGIRIKARLRQRNNRNLSVNDYSSVDEAGSTCEDVAVVVIV